MGWRLAEAVLDHCPDLSYREFRLLMALAHTVRDSTRRAMPGAEAMALRCNCGIRTVERAMAGLNRRGLVKLIIPAAPGRRAVYELLFEAVDNPAVDNPNARHLVDGSTPDSSGSTPDTSLTPTPDTEVADLSSFPSRTPVSQRLAAVRIVAASLGIGEDEATEIVERIQAEHHPRDITRYVKTLDHRGDLRRYLSCDRTGPGSHSEACRRGDGSNCPKASNPRHWCSCRCHPPQED